MAQKDIDVQANGTHASAPSPLPDQPHNHLH